MTENGRVAGGLPVEDSKASYDRLTRRHAIGSSTCHWFFWPVLRVYWACVCLSVSVCMRTMSGRVILAEPSGNVSVSSPFVFFSLLHAHTHADSHMARHVNVTSFFNRSFYTHTLKNRCGWVQLSLPDESFLSLHPLISYFTRTHS